MKLGIHGAAELRGLRGRVNSEIVSELGEAYCRPLNSGAINEVVDAVDRWYDAFFNRAIREIADKHPKKSSAK